MCKEGREVVDLLLAKSHNSALCFDTPRQLEDRCVGRIFNPPTMLIVHADKSNMSVFDRPCHGVPWTWRVLHGGLDFAEEVRNSAPIILCGCGINNNDLCVACWLVDRYYVIESFTRSRASAVMMTVHRADDARTP